MPALSAREITLLAIVAVALALVISNRMRPDLVALLTLLSLGLGGVVTPEQALAGFSRPAVVTIAGLFVISAALERTGVAQWIAERLATLSGTSEPRLLALFMGAGALLSLAMNNIAAGAVLLPAAVSAGRQTGVPASRLLMPLSFGTLLGGMATLFTTANIVVSGSMEALGLRPLTMRDFLPTGGATLVAGMLYMVLVGRRLLPQRDSAARAALARTDLTQTYQLAERLWEVRVRPESALVGQRLADSVIGARLGATVVAIWRGREARFAPAPADTIAAGDILLVLGREERVRQLETLQTVIGRDGQSLAAARELPVYLTEVVVGPRSPAIGQTLKELRFRSKYGLTAVALWREGRSYRTDVGDFPLQAGDALLMVGPREKVRALAQEPGFIVLDAAGLEEPHPIPEKALVAVAIAALVLLISALGWAPTAEAVLAGAAALVLTRCLDMEQVYRAIEWRVVVLVAGFLPIGTALLETGLAERIGQGFAAAAGSAGPLALIASLWLFAALLTQFIGGQVTALVMGPIAISAALELGTDPAAAAVAVALACSAAFITPIAHPVNVLMMGAGGYTFGDFPRVGVGLMVVCFVTLLAAMVLFWRI
ncbi:MAG TPA: SLC13 family permease [Roseiflexaceae bacterium]|nr:SLC13 family permease [Roseiflexaceae bacterium]